MRLLKYSLLARGLLPRELPPPFNSLSLGKLLGTNLASPPKGFDDPKRTYRIGTHTLARVGNLRRTLGIPNPVPFSNLCEFIDTEWQNLKPAAQRSNISLSRPYFDMAGERALRPSSSLAELPYKRAQARANAQYALVADINRFYGSIYTHSIPWALHGKSIAKAKRDKSLIGNVMDLWARNLQDGQTLGIPIGPDTSLLIAEIILGGIDTELMGSAKDISGWRYVDDYELYFSTLSAAEDALSKLQELLLEYELILNPTKTKISELQRSLQAPWVDALAEFEPGKTQSSEKKAIIRFFDTAFRLAHEHPHDYVLSFAIGRLKDIRTDPVNWPLVQSLMLQCAMMEPGTLRIVLSTLFLARNKKAPISQIQIEEALNRHVSRHAPLHHTGEVGWALWGLSAFNVILHEGPAKSVSKISDSSIALTALDAHSRKLIPTGLDLELWTQHMKTSELSGPLWMLAYEANVKGWLPSADGKDHVMEDPCFNYLKSHGVTFYDSSRYPPAIVEEGYSAPRTPF